MRQMRAPARLLAVALLGVALVLPLRADQDPLTFRAGVDLVNVTVTVANESGRFVSGLKQNDFVVYDDSERQEITHFSSERAPVSLGILMDVSGSMTGEKMSKAREAINRLVVDLLHEDDEIFLVEFSEDARVVQAWTSDRRRILDAVGRDRPVVGGTALYDAIAYALPLAAAGQHQKKALLVLSDGNDQSSEIPANVLRQSIHESEVLVYALGMDNAPPPRRALPGARRPTGRPPVVTPPPFPIPGPFPGTRRRRPPPFFPQLLGGAPVSASSGDPVNADALRRITDDTGGRTEIIRELDDLNDATARIAEELSSQYSLAYQSPRKRDGQWHDIRVEVARRGVIVRSRTGYVAS